MPTGVAPQRTANALPVVLPHAEHKPTGLHGPTALGAGQGAAGHGAHPDGGWPWPRSGTRYVAGGLNPDRRQAATPVGGPTDHAREQRTGKIALLRPCSPEAQHPLPVGPRRRICIFRPARGTPGRHQVLRETDVRPSSRPPTSVTGTSTVVPGTGWFTSSVAPGDTP